MLPEKKFAIQIDYEVLKKKKIIILRQIRDAMLMFDSKNPKVSSPYYYKTMQIHKILIPS